VDPAWRDRLVGICPPGQPLAKTRSLAFRARDGQRFISFEPGPPTRKAIDAIVSQPKLHRKEAVAFDNIETAKRGVLIANAISIVPGASVQSEVEAGTLVRIPIDGPQVWRPLGIIRRRTRALTPAMREMISLLQKGAASEDASPSDPAESEPKEN